LDDFVSGPKVGSGHGRHLIWLCAACHARWSLHVLSPSGTCVIDPPGSDCVKALIARTASYR
jgi:hypothetical protein